MRALQRTAGIAPRAPALRSMAITRTLTTDTLRARHNHPSHQPDRPTASSPNSGVEFAPSQTGVFPRNHHNTTPEPTTSSRSTPFPPLDYYTRSLFSTQIYHGQPRPSYPPTNRRSIHTSTPLHSPALTGPATGAGTGVLISAQMFGTEVKGNPTESEAYVAADRCEDDPLPPGLHHTICLGAGDAGPRMTESEEDVVADRGGGEDPLWAFRNAASSARGH